MASAQKQNSVQRRPLLDGQVNFPLLLAPMVGLSHVALRELVRDYLPAGATTLWPTEMLNSRRLPVERVGATAETLKSPRDSHLVPQILGNEEKPIRESVTRLLEWGAVAIDINMGCPVAKALKHNYGVALMGDAGYAADVVAMAVEASATPVSVKLRGAEQGDFQFLIDFVRRLEAAGASWITLHPRTATQGRRGRADWDQIRDLRDHVSIPIIGNGDIQIADDIFQMLEKTQADAVMAGRALTSRPWLLWQAGEAWGFPPPVGREGERAPHRPDQEARECARAVLRYSELCYFYFSPFSEGLALRKFMFYIKTMSPWLIFGHELFSICSAAKTFDDLNRRLHRFFAMEQRLMDRTELRI